jgi:hypothetical protein
MKHTFRGTRKFEIFEGCIGYSKAYSLISSYDVTVNFTVVQTVSKWKVRQLLHNMTVPQLDLMIPDPPTRDKPVDDLLL